MHERRKYASKRQLLVAICITVGAVALAVRPHVRPYRLAAWAQCLLNGGSLQEAGLAYRDVAMKEDVVALLDLPQNEPLRTFLQQAAMPAPTEQRLEPLRLRWEEIRGQVLYEGCKDTRTLDPDLPSAHIDVTVPFDLAAAEAIEKSFGCPDPFPLIWGRSDYETAAPALETRVREALGQRGLLYDGRSARLDYVGMVRQAMPALAPIVPEVLRVFPRIANQAGRPAEVVALVSLVQRGVRYVTIPSQPGWENGGMRSPLMTLRYGGDCDSKCVLLAAMLRVADPRLPIVLITTRGGGPAPSDDENHMLMGVGIPANECDVTVRVGNQVYVIIETTDGWGIGVAPKEFDTANIDQFIEIPRGL